MGTLQPESDTKRELDDSGCVQDVPPSTKQEYGDNGQSHPRVQLLDLSDDVLLYILKHCSPRDLKALGYTCERLGSLIVDRTLWQHVDARDHPCGRARLRWMLAYALSSVTRELLLTGYSREARGCLGHVNRTRKEAEAEKAEKELHEQLQQHQSDNDKDNSDNNNEPGPSTSEDRGANNRSAQNREVARNDQFELPQRHRQNARYLIINAQQLPRFSGSPAWPEDDTESEPEELDPESCVLSDGSCPGPQFTLTQLMLRQLGVQCSALEFLALEYCNINCNTTGLNFFPANLKKLSLRGVKCYNLPLDKSFLFKIHDHLPVLEYLDISECEWMEPASILPISKMSSLRQLLLRHCYRLSEFVAYASLAGRYGFRQLEYLDLRGSPVGDSEVSALGWLPELQELYLSPAPEVPPWPREHSHYKDDTLAVHMELESWELPVPDYFTMRLQPIELTSEPTRETMEEQIERLLSEDHDNPAGTSCYRKLTLAQRIEAAERLKERIEHDEEEKKRAKVAKRVSGGNNRCNRKGGQVGPPCKRRRSNESKQKGKGKLPPHKKQEKLSDKKKKKSDSDSDSSDDEDNIPLKRLCQNGVNDGASTSKDCKSKPTISRTIDVYPKQCMCEGQPKNQSQVMVSYSISMPEQNQTRSRESRRVVSRRPREEERQVAIIEDPEPHHHVLYVNLRQQVHTVYRLSVDNDNVVCHRVRNQVCTRPSNRNIFYTPPRPHVDATSLITDSAVRRFGRADGEDINYINIGPNGPYAAGPELGTRPNRSNLRVLSITGFRNITDRSLEHLATAAPHLRLIDFTETRVTEQGVENFRGLRPDCRVKFSEYVSKKANADD